LNFALVINILIFVAVKNKKMTVESINDEIVIRIPHNASVGEMQEVIDLIKRRKIAAKANAKAKPAAKKPSDFFGTLSDEEGEKFQKYIIDTRLEWERNI
jgi:hypothetical protein